MANLKIVATGEPIEVFHVTNDGFGGTALDPLPVNQFINLSETSIYKIFIKAKDDSNYIDTVSPSKIEIQDFPKSKYIMVEEDTILGDSGYVITSETGRIDWEDSFSGPITFEVEAIPESENTLLIDTNGSGGIEAFFIYQNELVKFPVDVPTPLPGRVVEGVFLKEKEGVKISGVEEVYMTNDGFGNSIYLRFIPGDFNGETGFIGKLRRATIDEPHNGGGFNINSDISIEVSLENNTGSMKAKIDSPRNKLYLLTPSDLDDFNSSFSPSKDGGSDNINFSTYIIALIQFPFKLPEDYIGPIKTVKIATYTTGASGYGINGNLLPIDLGEIQVPELRENSIDYSSEYRFFIPFKQEPVQIDSFYVVGKTVKIEMILNLYTGQYTLNFFVEGEEPFITETGELGIDIPLRLFDSVSGQVSGASGTYNEILTPFVEIRQPEIIEGEYNNLITIIEDVSTHKGYFEVLYGRVNVQATSEEKDEINSLLKDGVFVK